MPSQLSDEARKVIERERVAAAKRVKELSAESRALSSVLANVEEELWRSSRNLQHAEELLGLAPQVPIDALDGELRGRRLREVAVALLRQRKGDDSEIHYKDLYAMLRENGIRVSGKDPAATLLAQISIAPEIESVRPRSGIYRLRANRRS